MIVTTLMNTNEMKKIYSKKENKMSIREKLLVLFVAFFVSFIGFNLIAASYAWLLNGANEARYETIKSYQAKGEVNSHQSPNCDDGTRQFTPFNPECPNSQ